MESKSVSDNCKWRIRNRMKNGEIVGLRNMYGYEIDRVGIKIQPEQAAVVRRVFVDYVSGLSCAKIAKALREENVPALFGGKWTDKRVRDMLKNEKYTGDALLQKKYVVDHLTKREKVNRGELPQYYVENTHEAIIGTETFRKVQELMAARYEQNKATKPTTNRYPFSHFILCEYCGNTYRRKTTHGRVTWQCGTFLTEGKAACPAKQIPEEKLIECTLTALGTPTLDSDDLHKRIRHIVVTGPNSLRYDFSDGHFVELGWQDRSRRESWTDEMREAARQKMKERWNR